jgi:L-ascorbate metabolism protein UlaG (beta-lactamase superfamily)
MKTVGVFLGAAALCAGCAGPMTQPAGTGVVKITPLGSHDGELCPRDRAMVFEDPDGTRILYDAGFTVRGPNDPRLGKIDAVLLSHVHGDHLGPAHQPSANAGTCGNPDFSVKVTPNSVTTIVAAGKKARVLAGSDMHTFLAAKVKAAGGNPKQVQLVRFGALAKVGGVSVATVPATHTNGVPPEFLDKPLSDMLRAHGLNADVGPPVGYVLQFTNGLVVYLSGDTGITAEQDITVRRYYKANLAVMNIGGTPFTTGPHESAFVIAELVKPNAVIATHVNEIATKGGKVVPGSKTDQFMKRVGIPAFPAVSGRTMSFDGSGRCTAGCS